MQPRMIETSSFDVRYYVGVQRRKAYPCESSLLRKSQHINASRLPESTLSAALPQRQVEWQDAGILDVTTIGDALAPATIAASVYAGRRYAEELGAPVTPNAPLFQREVAELRPFDVRALFSRDT